MKIYTIKYIDVNHDSVVVDANGHYYDIHLKEYVESMNDKYQKIETKLMSEKQVNNLKINCYGCNKNIKYIDSINYKCNTCINKINEHECNDCAYNHNTPEWLETERKLMENVYKFETADECRRIYKHFDAYSETFEPFPEKGLITVVEDWSTDYHGECDYEYFTLTILPLELLKDYVQAN